MSGQLVFCWDRIENFLITRDRLVGIKSQIQNTKAKYHVC